MSKKIKIRQGDIISGNLHLSDGGHTHADKKEEITWVIQDRQDNVVKSISEIRIKPGNPNIFSWHPSPKGDGTWKGTVASNAKDDQECEYAIYWRHKGQPGHEPDHICDPKISVNPTPSLLRLIFNLIMLCLFGFFTVKFLQKRWEKK